MASPAGNERALLTARVGAMRVGAFRVGYTPKDTDEAFYIWTMVRGAVPTKEPGGADTTWTTVKE